MAIDPEISFHRFLVNCEHRSVPSLPGIPDRRRLKGKADLQEMPSNVAASLAAAQKTTNANLRAENLNVPEHVTHPPFHFDYIDSNFPEAMAFVYDDHSFIGVSISLISLMLEVGDRFANSTAISEALQLVLRHQAADIGKLKASFFEAQFLFVIAHEYTHHVHGHVPINEPELLFLSESTNDGSVAQHAKEADADMYATFNLLPNIFNGELRKDVIDALCVDEQPRDVQDEALLSFFVVTVAGLFFALPHPHFESTKVCNSDHPPRIARLHYILWQATGWCGIHLTKTAAWMSSFAEGHVRFKVLFDAVSVALRGMDGHAAWEEEISYLLSAEGKIYFNTSGL